jgi:3-hydroxyacyl-CoA dehydrogenase / enoyl-CoA hydratase / 3-hydroxybutyryl-CoA epimerase / enoyl-CoA isomerase
VEQQLRPDSILATNTSTLRIERLAEGLQRPERFCGMHFFNPVHRMPLVEIIRGPRTEGAVIARVYAFALRLGKVPVVVEDGPGFLVNRVLGPYLNEAAHLLQEGCTVEAVDQAAVDFGLPMGPLRLIDEVGIDVASHAGRILHDAFGDRMEPAPALVALAASGRLGKKAGLGLYRHHKDRPAQVDPEVYSLLGQSPPARRQTSSSAEIVERLILSMINEAAHLLEDGIAHSPEDVDLALILGAGFPPFRGGLLRHADAQGLGLILESLNRLHRLWGQRFAPAPALVRLAESEVPRFYDGFALLRWPPERGGLG